MFLVLQVTKWVLLQFMTLWEFSCCWCAADCIYFEGWCVHVNYRLVICESGDRCGSFILMSRCVRHWGYPDVFGHLELLFWWTDAPGGWRDTCAGFQRNEFWWMFCPKMGSGQISVEITVVASILDAGVWVLLLQKLYSSYVMMRFCNLCLLSIGAISSKFGNPAYIFNWSDDSCYCWCLIELFSWLMVVTITVSCWISP